MMPKSVLIKRLCAVALSLLGVSSVGMAAGCRSKTVEGFKLQDTEICVYGGQENYITTKLYGSVFDAKTKEPLAGIKVAVYNGTRQMAEVFTDEKGVYYFDDMDLWAGVGVDYTMIVSDPKKKLKPMRRDLSFETYEVTREEIVFLESKK